MQQLPLAMRLRERAVFDSFVPGREPRGRAAACAPWRSAQLRRGAPGCADRPASARAICCRRCARRPQRQQVAAAYLPLAQLHAAGPRRWRAGRAARLLALDDLGCIIGDRGWEQALFGLYREVAGARRGAGGGCGRAAAAVAAVRAAGSGLALCRRALLPLRPLEEAEQREALRLRAQARGLELPEETALYLQRRFRRDLPTLYQLLDTSTRRRCRRSGALTVPFIRAVLEPRTPQG